MKEDFIVILGTAHRKREPGKMSPDKRLREYAYSREVASLVKAGLQEKGYNAVIDFEEPDLPKDMRSTVSKIERSRELKMRVDIVNDLCRKYGRYHAAYVSIHVDASNSDNEWHSPHGWSVRVSPYASASSRKLAEALYDTAKGKWLFTRHPTDKQKFWVQNLTVLNDTSCPAVLTENLFQDNKSDVNFLLSEKGRQTIVDLHVEGIIKYIESL